jgi:hypothetical protein
MDNLRMLLKILNEGADDKIILEEKVLPEVKEQKKPVESSRPKRCQHESCKIKIMLADFPCKCSNFYCSQHRYSESHKCSFDYKSQGVKLLEEQLVKANGSKLNKI